MNYKWEFEKFWGKGAKPEPMYVSQEAYDALQKKLAEPPDPKVVERFREILNKPAPWDEKDNIKPMIELGEKWMLENDETLRKLADS